ncbi:hypothetical protein V9T40_008257 [Parthenolecanium corni]|uniref:Sialin n=1 Tax=Parthenolecanium corni TaxID=536013 RepID=A0AAN9Y6E6_9HEMI
MPSTMYDEQGCYLASAIGHESERRFSASLPNRRVMSEPDSSWWRRMLLRRNVVTLLAFLGFLNTYMHRVNLSVAIVAMTSNRTLTAPNGTEYQTAAEFDWDMPQKGNMLSSFFYGYVTTQLAGGWLGSRFGGVRVLGASVFASSLLSLLAPTAAYVGYVSLLVTRVFTGVVQGVTFPCIHAVWSNWAPPQERTKLASIAYAGGFFGTVVAFPASGYLANAFGWPSAFYIPAVTALVWCVAWFVWVRDNPQDDRWITRHELELLERSLGSVRNEKIPHPWAEYFKSMPVWAIVCAHFCQNWGFYTMLTHLPSFVTDTLNFDIEKAAFLAALPFLVMSVGLFFVGSFVDMLREKHIFTTTQVRKIFNCGASVGQAIFMVAAARVHDSSLCIFSITATIGLGALAWAAFSVNPLDIAPKQASVIMGISNTFGTLAGIFSPTVAGYIVRDKTRAEWRIVMDIAAAIYASGAVFYGVFASGDLQPWAVKPNSDQNDATK